MNGEYFEEMIKEGFESSTVKTLEFKNFGSKFIKYIKSSIDGEVKLSINHFYISGFIKRNDKYIYISTGDVRWDNKVLVRTAKNDQDYTGGHNNFTSYSNLINFILNFN